MKVDVAMKVGRARGENESGDHGKQLFFLPRNMELLEYRNIYGLRRRILP